MMNDSTLLLPRTVSPLIVCVTVVRRSIIGNFFPVDADDVVANCNITEVALLNRRACTPAVSAAANFFVDHDDSAAARQCDKK